VGADPAFGAVADGADVQVGVEGAEGALDVGEGLAGGDDLAGFQAVCDAGAQHVDAVQGGFGGDGVLVAGVAEVVVADVDAEVLGDFAAAQHPVGAERDLVRAAQRPPFPGARGGDLGQVGLGCGEQRFALAGPLGFQERPVGWRGWDAGTIQEADSGLGDAWLPVLNTLVARTSWSRSSAVPRHGKGRTLAMVTTLGRDLLARLTAAAPDPGA
jgi:hypothetical protein